MPFASVQNWLIKKMPSSSRPKKKKAAETQGWPVWKSSQKPTSRPMRRIWVPGSTQSLGTLPTPRL